MKNPVPLTVLKAVTESVKGEIKVKIVYEGRSVKVLKDLPFTTAEKRLIHTKKVLISIMPCNKRN